MKRPLEYIAGGFVLGEVLALLPVVWMMVISAGILAGVCYLWEKKGRSFIWWLLPIFVAFGFFWLKEDGRREEGYRQSAGALKDKTVTLHGTIKGIKEDRDNARLTLELKKVKLECEGKGFGYGNVMAYVDLEGITKKEPGEPVGLHIGMTVLLEGELELFPDPGNPGEFDYGNYYHSLGIEGRFFGKGLIVENSNEFPLFDGLYRIKCRAGKILDSITSEKDRGIFKAMVLGEKSELPTEIRKLYQNSGIAHLLAISGLHISMIGMGVFGVCRKMGLGLKSAGLAGGFITVCYGILAGGMGLSASVVRAVIMVLMQLLAGCLGRTYDLRTAAGVSGLLLLIESPTLLFQAGFQLSFGAVLALGIVVPLAERWLSIKSGPGKTLIAGAVIQLATCPVIMYHYFEYPVYAILLNLVVIPLMSYVLLSGILGVLAGSVLAELGILAVGTGHYVLKFYQWICQVILYIPGSVFITGRPSMRQVITYTLLWWGMLAVMGNLVKKEIHTSRKGQKSGTEEMEGENEKGKGKRRIGVILFTVASLWVLLVRMPIRGMEVTFLDVGQGDGICIQTKDKVILVDGGSSDKKKLGDQILIPFLKSQGISQVDYVIISHADQDHISGLTELLKEDNRIHINTLILPWPGQNSGDKIYEELGNLGKEQGGRVAWMKRGDGIQSDNLKITCLYTCETETGDRNDHSLLLEVKYDQAGILLTGDMNGKGEKEWLAKGDKVQIQILKVAHHGSGFSTQEEFLSYLSPDFAIISYGEQNRYGHPSPQTLERLRKEEVKCYHTVDRGAIKVKTDGRNIGISTFR